MSATRTPAVEAPPSTHGINEEMRERLHAAGLRATPQRLAVLGAFAAAPDRHLSADDVWARIRATGMPTDRSTAFRSVTSLVEAGLLHPVRFHDGIARFELQQQTHHHGVCVVCGATVDIDPAAMSALSRRLTGDSGFALGNHPQLLSGICRECNRRSDAPA